MEVLRTKEVVDETASWLQNRVDRYEAKSLFLPAGETPRPLYALWRKKEPAYLRGLRLLQVDDVASGAQTGVFAKFFSEELPALTVIPPDHPERADLAVLGLGTNGHVAFHEPGLPNEFRFGEVQLHEDTLKRLALAPGTRGRTYGIGIFLEAKALLLVVRGENKRAALERFLAGDPTLPASALRHHPDLTVVTDLV